MSRWALISGATVVTVVDSAAQPTTPGVWVDCTAAPAVSAGYLWNGAAFAVPPSGTSLVQRAFWRRFTSAEREAMQGLIDTGTQNQKNKLKSFRDYVQTGGTVDLADDYIISSVTLLETATVIAAGRATTILTTPVAVTELR